VDGDFHIVIALVLAMDAVQAAAHDAMKANDLIQVVAHGLGKELVGVHGHGDGPFHGA
jgi:hypothetical protein